MLRHHATVLSAVALAASLAACSADPVLPPVEDLATAPDLAMTPPDLVPTVSGIGDPCTGPGGLSQGSCGPGQLCVPDGQFGYVDGYCSASCVNSPCPDDAECINFGPGGAFCHKKCTSADDCRTGYLCGSFGGGTPDVCRPESFGGGGGNGGGVTPGSRDGGAACVTPVLGPENVDGGVWGKNTQITGSGQSIEAEVQLAVAPGGKDVVVSYNKLTAPAGIGVVKSTDDGLSFSREVVLPLDTMVDKNNTQSDPVVASDSKGNFYISWVGYNLSQRNPNPTNMNIYVARSSNGGITLDLVSMAAPMNDAGNGGQLDKPWIYASPFDDSLWVTWCRFNANGTSDIRMSRSTDRGLTFTPPVSINDAGKRGTVTRNLAQVAIGADGRVAIAWVEIGNVQFGSTGNAVYLQRMNPDGTPASPTNVKVTAMPDSPAFDDPSVAVFGDNVYVGFISGTPRGDWDVRVAASLDGGATFKPSVKANDDATCATHFHHQIAVDKKGNLHAIWYDNRYRAGNLFWTMSGPADAMNPLLFARNQFVNDRTFTFTTRRDRENWLGDYLGLWIAGGQLYAAWTDNRTTGRSHIFFAKAKAPE